MYLSDTKAHVSEADESTEPNPAISSTIERARSAPSPEKVDAPHKLKFCLSLFAWKAFSDFKQNVDACFVLFFFK